MSAGDFVSWLHIGDLHGSDEDGWESVATLSRIVDDVRAHVPTGALAFAFLPGDNANHGEAEQYRRIAEVLDRLDLPCHAIPGDHDFEPGSLARFEAGLGTDDLPASRRVGGRRALFLDIVSAGSGGPDFRLGAAQTTWLRGQLDAARTAGEPRPIVFMHALPGDLHEGAREIGRLFADAHVAFVDTGHTHYNELINDGAVIYSATRSTGQVEEGDAGFAIAAVDGDAPSWRFKALGSPWPWVLITSPADERLTVDGRAVGARDAIDVHALVLGTDVASVSVRIDGAEAVAMTRVAERPGLWTATLAERLDGVHAIRVDAQASDGTTGSDTIRLRTAIEPRTSDVLGVDRHSVGAWPEHGLLGTKLGPNANGKDW